MNTTVGEDRWGCCRKAELRECGQPGVPKAGEAGGGSCTVTLPTNRRSLSPGWRRVLYLIQGKATLLGNRCQFAAITIRNILSLADASQQGNRALCSGEIKRIFFFQAQGGHLIHLFLSPSPSITAWGRTIYRACISCLFRYRTFSKPLQKKSELEMNLRPKQQLSLPPPCPQAGSTFLPGRGSPGP